jgi:hypothetical protein
MMVIHGPYLPEGSIANTDKAANVPVSEEQRGQVWKKVPAVDDSNQAVTVGPIPSGSLRIKNPDESEGNCIQRRIRIKVFQVHECQGYHCGSGAVADKYNFLRAAVYQFPKILLSNTHVFFDKTAMCPDARSGNKRNPPQGKPAVIIKIHRILLKSPGTPENNVYGIAFRYKQTEGIGLFIMNIVKFPARLLPLIYGMPGRTAHRVITVKITGRESGKRGIPVFPPYLRQVLPGGKGLTAEDKDEKDRNTIQAVFHHYTV